MSKKQSTRDRLIDSGWRYGSAVGLAVGLLAGASTNPDTPYSCSDRSPSAEVTNCFSDGLVAALKPYLICMGAGLLVGALMGALLMRGAYVSADLIRKRIQLRGTNATQSPAGASPSVASPARRMVARYASACASCGGQIEVGTLIEHRGPRETVCGTCATAQPLPAV